MILIKSIALPFFSVKKIRKVSIFLGLGVLGGLVCKQGASQSGGWVWVRERVCVLAHWESSHLNRLVRNSLGVWD